MANKSRVSNIDINDRIKQVIILTILILVGIFISSVVNGQSNFKKEKVKKEKVATIKKSIVLKSDIQ